MHLDPPNIDSESPGLGKLSGIILVEPGGKQVHLKSVSPLEICSKTSWRRPFCLNILIVISCLQSHSDDLVCGEP